MSLVTLSVPVKQASCNLEKLKSSLMKTVSEQLPIGYETDLLDAMKRGGLIDFRRPDQVKPGLQLADSVAGQPGYKRWQPVWEKLRNELPHSPEGHLLKPHEIPVSLGSDWREIEQISTPKKLTQDMFLSQKTDSLADYVTASQQLLKERIEQQGPSGPTMSFEAVQQNPDFLGATNFAGDWVRIAGMTETLRKKIKTVTDEVWKDIDHVVVLIGSRVMPRAIAVQRDPMQQGKMPLIERGISKSVIRLGGAFDEASDLNPIIVFTGKKDKHKMGLKQKLNHLLETIQGFFPVKTSLMPTDQPDVLSMSREEIFEHINKEVKEELNNDVCKHQMVLFDDLASHPPFLKT